MPQPATWGGRNLPDKDITPGYGNLSWCGLPPSFCACKTAPMDMDDGAVMTPATYRDTCGLPLCRYRETMPLPANAVLPQQHDTHRPSPPLPATIEHLLHHNVHLTTCNTGLEAALYRTDSALLCLPHLTISPPVPGRRRMVILPTGEDNIPTDVIRL